MNARIDNVVRGTAVLLILLLSVALYREKVDNASLRGELTRNTRPFVLGEPLPDLPVRDAAGDSLMLREFCGNRAVVLVFSSDACDSCRELEPEWLELARISDRHKVVVVNPSAAVEGTNESGIIAHVAALPGEIIRAFGFSEVPTLVLADASCRIAAAGVGLASSRSLLDMISDGNAL